MHFFFSLLYPSLSLLTCTYICDVRLDYIPKPWAWVLLYISTPPLAIGAGSEMCFSFLHVFFVFIFAFFLSFLRVVVRWLNLNWPRPYLLLRRFQLGLGLAGGRVIGGHSASLITRSVTVCGWLRPGVSCGFTFLVCGGLYRSRGVCLNRGVDRHLRWH